MNFMLTAAENTKNMNGGYGLLVVLALGALVFLLFRSMNKHLRKVARMKDEEDAQRAAAERTATRKPPRPRR